MYLHSFSYSFPLWLITGIDYTFVCSAVGTRCLFVKSWLIERDPDVGKDWGQEEKGTTEDGVVGWHHQLHGHEFEQAPGVDDGQGGLACCSLWGHKESDTTERLNWTELNSAYTGMPQGLIFYATLFLFYLPLKCIELNHKILLVRHRHTQKRKNQMW